MCRELGKELWKYSPFSPNRSAPYGLNPRMSQRGSDGIQSNAAAIVGVTLCSFQTHGEFCHWQQWALQDLSPMPHPSHSPCCPVVQGVRSVLGRLPDTHTALQEEDGACDAFSNCPAQGGGWGKILSSPPKPEMGVQTWMYQLLKGRKRGSGQGDLSL